MADDESSEFERMTRLGKQRADEFTEEILSFVQKLEMTRPRNLDSSLIDLALARALIVHLVRRFGVQRGLAEARDAFDTTFDQIRSILENMGETKGPFPL